MPIANQVKFGTLILGGGSSGSNVINSLDKGKVPGTLKAKFGGTFNLTVIPGRARDRTVTISGLLQGTNKDSDKSTLIGYEDDVRRYEDGVDNGDYIIAPGSLVFNDTGKQKTIFSYSMTLIEWNQ